MTLTPRLPTKKIDLRPQVLAEYRNILRQSRRFFDPIARLFIQFKAKQAFTKHKDLDDPHRIKKFITKARKFARRIQRANEHDTTAAQHIIDYTYGLRGPMKHFFYKSERILPLETKQRQARRGGGKHLHLNVMQKVLLADAFKDNNFKKHLSTRHPEVLEKLTALDSMHEFALPTYRDKPVPMHKKTRKLVEALMEVIDPEAFAERELKKKEGNRSLKARERAARKQRLKAEQQQQQQQQQKTAPAKTEKEGEETNNVEEEQQQQQQQQQPTNANSNLPPGGVIMLKMPTRFMESIQERLGKYDRWQRRLYRNLTDYRKIKPLKVNSEDMSNPLKAFSKKDNSHQPLAQPHPRSQEQQQQNKEQHEQQHLFND